MLKNFLSAVQTSLDTMRNQNIKSSGSAYIPFNSDDSWHNAFGIGNAEQKVFRLPYPYFTIVKLFKNTSDALNTAVNSENTASSDCYFEIYAPSKLPLAKKSRLYSGSFDDTTLHRNDFFELIYIYSGSINTQIEGEELSLHEKDLIILDPKCIRRNLRSYNATVLYFCFRAELINDWFMQELSGKLLKTYFSQDGQSDHPGFLVFHLGRETDSIEENMARILTEMEQQHVNYDKIAAIYTLRILNACVDQSDINLTTFSKKTNQSNAFLEITDFINRHINTITLDDLCAEFHFQKDYFNRVIKKYTGTTYTEYVRNLRIQKVAYLLRESQASLNEILNECGFKQHSYFYRTFKELYGMTPEEYRDLL